MEFVKKNIKIIIAALSAMVFFDFVKPLFNAIFRNVYELFWKQPSLDVFDTHATSREFFSSLFSTVATYISSALVACGIYWVGSFLQKDKAQPKEKAESPRVSAPESPSSALRATIKDSHSPVSSSPRALFAQAALAASVATAKGLPRTVSPRAPSPIPGSKSNSPRTDQTTSVSQTAGLNPPSSTGPAKGQLEVVAGIGRRRSPSMESSPLATVNPRTIADRLRPERAKTMGGYENPPGEQRSASPHPLSRPVGIRPVPSPGEERSASPHPLSRPAVIRPVPSLGEERSISPYPHSRPAGVPPLIIPAPPPVYSPRGSVTPSAAAELVASLLPQPKRAPPTPRPKGGN